MTAMPRDRRKAPAARILLLAACISVLLGAPASAQGIAGFTVRSIHKEPASTESVALFVANAKPEPRQIELALTSPIDARFVEDFLGFPHSISADGRALTIASAPPGFESTVFLEVRSALPGTYVIFLEATDGEDVDAGQLSVDVGMPPSFAALDWFSVLLLFVISVTAFHVLKNRK